LINFSPEDENFICKIWDRQVSHISSGQIQLFFILLSLSSKADLIILDEPTSFLDIDTQTKFYNKLKKIKLNKETTFFLISHDMHNVIKTADQVLCINNHICCRTDSIINNIAINEDMSLFTHKHDHKH
ncbi:MAG: AAA family ATPase, partial [Rickettsiaceae bacterium]|nr:AAA family ATPase [Rickettsiaceae bacterium]